MESPLLSDTRDRRRVERRTNQRLAELTLPELRRMALTTALFLVVLVLFVAMVRDVLIAGILGAVIGYYLRPLYLLLLGRTRSRAVAAILTLALVIVPVLGLLAYSYAELRDVAGYVATHQREITDQIDAAVRRFPYGERWDARESVERWVLLASNYGARLPGILRDAIKDFSVATTIFLFTAFYILTQGETIVAYIRGKIPPRYSQLSTALEMNVRGVLYGAIWATLVTQTVKSLIILLMNVSFGVPLAAVLAIIAFVIGFFPIVGSWSVYLPVALWLLIFRDARVAALLMVLIGFFVNTVFISTYLRPKLAAQKSRVLNFYWMFIGLVCGVYTFGLSGILLGPILIGLLKAILDTVTSKSNWVLLETEDDDVPAAGPVVTSA